MILVLAVFTALTLVLSWRMLAHPATFVLGQGADTALNVWILAWNSHALLSQPLRLFQANIFFPLPQTLAYSEHLLGLWPLAAPVHLAGGDPVLAYNVAVAATHILAGMGMFLLVRHHTASVPAGLIGGLAYAFGPFRLVHLSRLSLLGGAWLPLALYSLERFAQDRSPRHWWLAWAFLLLLGLSSWYWVLFGGLIVLLYAAALDRQRLRPPGPVHLAAPLAVAMLLLVLALPYIGQADLFRGRDVEHAARFSARPLDFLTAGETHPLLGRLTAPLRAREGMHFERFGYPGLSILALAVLGLLRGRGTLRLRRSLAVIVLAGLILSFGPLLPPYRWLLELLPPLGFMRFPVRWLFLGHFGLALLVGLGAPHLVARRPPLRLVLAGGLAALVLLDSGFAPQPAYRLGPREALPDVYRHLASQPGQFGVLELPMYVHPQDEEPEVRRQYASAVHWKSLVNGFSGGTPTRQRELQRAVHCLSSAEAQRALQDLQRQGLRYVLLHLDQSALLAGRWARWERPPWLVEEGRWGEAVLLRVEEGDPVTPLEVPGAAMATFQDGIRLQEWAFDAASGDLTVTWSASGWPGHDYTVFAHLVGPDGQRLSQSDAWPGHGRYPTSQWCPGDVWTETRPLAPQPPPGSRIYLGLYRLETLDRLPVLTSDLPMEDQALVLDLD